jgi:hypothetical protein
MLFKQNIFQINSRSINIKLMFDLIKLKFNKFAKENIYQNMSFIY